MAHLYGEDRSQILLLPDSVDDYVGPDNPVRFIDAFVDGLDLEAAGFRRVQPKETGRPGYDPADLLKLYIYGYLNRVRSSRRLEAETHRNLEAICLLRRLRPDVKTIADFRRDNRGAFRHRRSLARRTRRVTLSGLRGPGRAVLVLSGVLLTGQIGSAGEQSPDAPLADWSPAAVEEYERQREAHARMAASGGDTMYASTPAPPDRFPLHLPVPHRWAGDQPAGQLAQANAIATDDGSSPAADEEDAVATHTVAFFPSARDAAREGFVQVINHGSLPGTVAIHAIDEAGRRFGPLSLSIGGSETVHFNSGDLETGNADKGLSGATGAGEGDWRVELESGLDIEVLAYVRTEDGFLTGMHDTVPAGGPGHRVAFFNPDRNADQVSRLRIVNAGDAAAEITVTGVDDRGAPGQGEVRYSVSASAARTVTAGELETGNGLDGALGEGTGKWQLLVESPGDLLVVNLLDGPTGHVTNLSTAPDLRDGDRWAVPLFPEADDAARRQGFVRVVNRSTEQGGSPGTVVRFTVPAGATRFVTAQELETGEDLDGASATVPASGSSWWSPPAGAGDEPAGEPDGPPDEPVDCGFAAPGPDRRGGLRGCGLGGRGPGEVRELPRRGRLSGNTRLVFVPDSEEDHLARNLDVFRDFVAEVHGGASLILNKIQEVAHGGGSRFPPGGRYPNESLQGLVRARPATAARCGPVRLARCGAAHVGCQAAGGGHPRAGGADRIRGRRAEWEATSPRPDP